MATATGVAMEKATMTINDPVIARAETRILPTG